MKKIVFLMVMLLVVLLAVPGVHADFRCGTGTCKSGQSCCDNKVCCPEGKNIYCSSLNKCYSSTAAAKKDCGENYTICASPAEGKNQELIRKAVGMYLKEYKDTVIPDVTPTTPVDPSETKSELNNSKTSATADTGKGSMLTIIAASSRDDYDQPCYVGGKYVGNCSLNKPYYHVFSDECYSTLKDCKKADGDLESAPGSGGCVRCGK